MNKKKHLQNYKRYFKRQKKILTNYIEFKHKLLKDTNNGKGYHLVNYKSVKKDHSNKK
jgi:hypothetical protein